MEDQKKSLKTLKERAFDAACKYYEKRSYEILDRKWTSNCGTIDVVAVDENEPCVAVIAVNVTREGDFPKAVLDRRTCERKAGAWLAEHPEYCGYAIRFDEISLRVLDDSRAFLRAHLNCFGDLSLDELRQELEQTKEKYARLLEALSDETREELKAQGII